MSLMLLIGVIRAMVVFPQRLLNESSSLLIAEADEYPSESHLQRYGSFRPYAIVVPRVEDILSRMLYIQNVEQ